mmetsp:Transcript_20107/g.41860  ORF Transcript_20107/g.41860 Transcript_20107/m.41860 type:complete len:237 (-) Transcript_20107:245-955(-)
MIDLARAKSLERKLPLLPLLISRSPLLSIHRFPRSDLVIVEAFIFFWIVHLLKHSIVSEILIFLIIIFIEVVVVIFVQSLNAEESRRFFGKREDTTQPPLLHESNHIILTHFKAIAISFVLFFSRQTASLGFLQCRINNISLFIQILPRQLLLLQLLLLQPFILVHILLLPLIQPYHSSFDFQIPHALHSRSRHHGFVKHQKPIPLTNPRLPIPNHINTLYPLPDHIHGNIPMLGE